MENSSLLMSGGGDYDFSFNGGLGRTFRVIFKGAPICFTQMCYLIHNMFLNMSQISKRVCINQPSQILYVYNVPKSFTTFLLRHK